MKIKIGPYVPHYSSYGFVTRLETRLRRDFSPKTSDRLETIVEKVLGWLFKLLNKRNRKVSIRIDPYDIWNADQTIAMVVVPVLKQLRNSPYAGCHIYVDDVPERLRPQVDNDSAEDPTYLDRWHWVLDEMIWTFEIYASEDTFDGVDMNDDASCSEHSARLANGLRLFAKYYGGLWT